MYKYLRSLDKFGIRLGLERVEALLSAMGNPQHSFKSIHVAGTNGKGSTCAMLASILQRAGYKVGLYTSPHLLDFRERIKINGRDISLHDFNSGLALIRKKAAGLKEKPTVFEVLTALAFWHFANKKVDYAIIEVGMGGRFDATNLIIPLVSIITNVELEHTAVLGKSLRKIAFEKGGIIKTGRPVVTAENKAEPLKVIKPICRAKGAPLIQVEKKQTISTNLSGEHQKINAACAVVAIRVAGIKVGSRAIKQGLNSVRWPARFQLIAKNPLTIIDGAHNPAGIKVLLAALRHYYPGRKFTFLLGVQKDKAVREMIGLIKPVMQNLILVHSSNSQARRIILNKKTCSLRQGLKLSEQRDRVIAGSLFLAADAIKRLDHKSLL